ncbi:hypothetical protein LOTGIDRAFT_167929 [Lottia gigantea]|uniref:RING-type domain-containing protein n=1 Tax=Lottia gigantea TaxID=225164 RepID=V3ZS60_LOTGI|nr:hypothetical protein LOTGIDRAFT_167929 [Lottia gigantea]ESO85350.1 hypothetical protein LOTGIDRAFT_167929 [Lottia gigantea]
MSSSIEDALSCHICAEIFKDPVEFPCSHSLCHSCLEYLLESSVGTVLQCPECKDVVQERSIRKNELLASIVDFYWEMTARADSDAKLMTGGQSGTRINQLIPQQNLRGASQGDAPKDSQSNSLSCDNPNPDQIDNNNSPDAKSAISKEQLHGFKDMAENGSNRY